MPEEKEPTRYEGVVAIDDGYVLVATVQDSDKAFPPVVVRYRPALPEAVYEYRLAMGRAATGKDVMNAKVAVIHDHVVGWTGVSRRTPTGVDPVAWYGPQGDRLGVLADPNVRRGLGADYLDQMVNLVCGFTPGRWEGETKNS